MAEVNIPAIDPQDAEQNKTNAILSLVCPVIPFITKWHETSPFVKFWMNQGIILWALDLALWVISVVFGFIPILNIVASILYGCSGLILVAFWVIGFLTGISKKEAKPLPLIGNLFTAIK